jgi:hypothetical protein
MNMNGATKKMKEVAMTAAILAAGSVLAFTALAGAQTTGTAAATQNTVVSINKDGKALVRGTIDALANGTITVKSWGGDWTVNVAADTQVLPVETGNDIAKFQVGDYVGAQGMINQGAQWTMDATLVRDWTYKATVSAEQKQNRQSASQTIKANTPKNYVGTASDVSAAGDGTFTLTVPGATSTATFAINVLSGAEVVNRNWLVISMENIANGDNVRVWGVNTNGTIAAQIVRDTTIPATSTPATQ